MGLTVVTGPPAGGKSTWVRERARPGDVVIDFDRLAVALTGEGADSHRHPPHLREVAFKARHAAIVEAVRHAGRVEVYVVDTNPSETALALYAAHDAEVVTVDPGRDVVLKRCEFARSAEATRAAQRWYDTHGTLVGVRQTSRDW